MAIDFPASPTNGQTFTSGSVTYTWDGTKWTAVAAAGSSNSISQGNTNATVTDTGSDGRFVVTTEGTERARIDSSGRLLVGTSSARTFLSWDTPQVQIEGTGYQQSSLALYNNENTVNGAVLALGHSRGTSLGSNTVVSNGDYFGAIPFYGSDGSNELRGAEIAAYVDGTPGAGDMPGRLVFSVTQDGSASPTERLRIGQNGAVNTFNGIEGLYVRTSNPTNNADPALSVSAGATNTQSGTRTFYAAANGNCFNQNSSYGGISDIKLKENIVDATTQWNDIKSLQVRKYNFKEETGQQTHTQIGLIAQEVELVSPGLVSESPDRDAEGNDLGTVTKSVNYSVLYMKAVKALQEAMERIETLEAKVAALESA